MTMLKPMKYNNTYAFSGEETLLKKIILKQLVIYKRLKIKIKPGFTMEFNDRSDGYKAVAKAYGLNLSNVKKWSLNYAILQ